MPEEDVRPVPPRRRHHAASTLPSPFSSAGRGSTCALPSATRPPPRRPPRGGRDEEDEEDNNDRPINPCNEWIKQGREFVISQHLKNIKHLPPAVIKNKQTNLSAAAVLGCRALPANSKKKKEGIEVDVSKLKQKQK